jgi:TRAP-type transport system periplasmic protein
MWKRFAAFAIMAIVFLYAWRVFDRIPIHVVGQPSQTGVIQKKLEQPFFEQLAVTTGLPLDIRYQTSDTLGIKDTHQLLMLKNRTLNLVSVRFLQNATVEPTLLGVDLIGFTTGFETARAIVEAYAPVLDRRLQERFDSKLLGIWPFGPQVFFCRVGIRGLSDLAGRKVRVGNENFAPLMASFGATATVIPFEDVEPALEKGLIDCAITSAGSGRHAGWAQHSTHYFPLGTQMGLNGYVVSLHKWNRLSSKQKRVLEQAFKQHVDAIWAQSRQVHEDESSCLVGGACTSGTRYHLVNVVPTPRDHQMLRDAFEATTFKDWATRCDHIYPGCSEDWHQRMAPLLNRPASAIR